MPKAIRDISQLVELAKRDDATEIRVKKITSGPRKGIVKLKVRTSKYLHTLTLDRKNAFRASKLISSLRSHVKCVNV
ncbi:Ribosomal protein L38e like protein [Aduncisulcus paluster]|uniref:Ribosomal protein L38e like protein n=1 Tax=Aduncisulcus paluster TaxID=2918883 RepID=A0ABQ5KWE6_9EUKA|nr:Ribosomal protein L38e like protein [Aduncisulcus paluster]